MLAAYLYAPHGTMAEDYVRSVFHFDLVNGRETIRDEDGTEADSLEQAVDEARAAVHEMRTAGELDAMGSGWTIVIRDARGTVLHSLPI